MRGRVSAACVLAGCLLTATACGSKGSVDSGGFTSAQRRAAQSALDLLRQTRIPQMVVGISIQSGQAPPTCIVLPKAGARDTFDLVIAWKPVGSYLNMRRTVLEATIGRGSAKNVSYQVSSYRNDSPLPPRVEATLERATLSKPAEQCQVLESGRLQLVLSQ